jgi:hypothetical protein
LRAGIPPKQFLKKMAEFEDGPIEAAVRWAVVLDDSAKLMVQLQGLPSTAAALNGKPYLKRYFSVLIILYKTGSDTAGLSMFED